MNKARDVLLKQWKSDITEAESYAQKIEKERCTVQLIVDGKKELLAKQKKIHELMNSARKNTGRGIISENDYEEILSSTITALNYIKKAREKIDKCGKIF